MKRFWLAALVIAGLGCAGEGTRLTDHWIHEKLDEDDAYNSGNKYYDSYWFRALETATAKANIDSDAFDPYLAVYDEDGRLVAQDDNSGAGDDANASFRVAFGKFYEVVVTSAREDETGEYDLNVTPQLQYDSVITRGRRSEAAVKRVRHHVIESSGGHRSASSK